MQRPYFWSRRYLIHLPDFAYVLVPTCLITHGDHIICPVGVNLTAEVVGNPAIFGGRSRRERAAW